jgi:hypothetical protein
MKFTVYFLFIYIITITLSLSIGDLDPHVFGPSGSISQRYRSGSGSGIFPFIIIVLSGLKSACKVKVYRNILSKNSIFRLKIVCQRVSYKK